jgi:hypothetical protein
MHVLKQMTSITTLVQTKIHIHSLENVTSSSLSTQHTCAFCGSKPIHYRCDACKYYACGSCVGAAKVIQAVPLHQHPLEYTVTVTSSSTTVPATTRVCDACQRSVIRESWRCRTCSYDLCILCFEAVSSPVAKSSSSTPPSSAPAKSTPVVAATTVTPSSTPFVRHAHGLRRNTPLSTPCNGCGATPLTTSYTCISSCNYHLCATCNDRYHITVVPLHAHALTYVTDNLKGHWCDGCSKSISICAWRCSACNFDVCQPCIDRITPVPAKPTPAPTPSPAKAETKTSVPPSQPTATTSDVDRGMTKAHRHELTRTIQVAKDKWCDGCKVSVSTSYSCVPCNL